MDTMKCKISCDNGVRRLEDEAKGESASEASQPQPPETLAHEIVLEYLKSHPALASKVSADDLLPLGQLFGLPARA